MMAAMAAAETAPTPEAPVDMDATMMEAMVAAEPSLEAPVEEAPTDIPAEPVPEIPAEPEILVVMPTEEMPADIPVEAPAEEAPAMEIPAEADIDPVMAAMIAAGDAPAPEAPAEPVAEEIPVEMPAEALTEEAPVDLEAMMAAEVRVEVPTEEAPVDLEAMMAAEMPTEEVPTEIPVDIPTEENPAPESSAENLDAMLNAELDALTEPVLEEPPVPEQMPVEFDMSAASEAMTGAVDDMKNFLDGEDYEYTLVKTSDKTLFLIKTEDGNSMAINYENDEFASLESTFDKDGKTGYADIMNVYVKDVIKNGGCCGIDRHKGSNVVAR